MYKRQRAGRASQIGFGNRVSWNKQFARFWQCFGGFGLRTSKADLVKLTERMAFVCQMLTPEEGSRPGCDFGTLYALTQIFQAFAAKTGDEALAGNDWHRDLNHQQSTDMEEALNEALDGARRCPNGSSRGSRRSASSAS